MKLELCAAEPAAIELAKKYGFDRIELCQALECGGLTPSPGLQRKALRSGVETHVLIRCRSGNFCYSASEKELMLEDISDAAALGIPGVVIGSLNKDHSIDADFVRQVRQSFPQLELTFHRAFDDVSDPMRALEDLIGLGVKRILTSGGKSSVAEGLEQLQELISLSAGRIEIMAGGGIRVDNIGLVLESIHPDAIHFSGTEMRKANGNSLFDSDLPEVSETKISALLEQIRAYF
ncbi:MAG: copper homeostasis protein CutC [Bacteroidota bacterium]